MTRRVVVFHSGDEEGEAVTTRKSTVHGSNWLDTLVPLMTATEAKPKPQRFFDGKGNELTRFKGWAPHEVMAAMRTCHCGNAFLPVEESQETCGCCGKCMCTSDDMVVCVGPPDEVKP